MTKKEQNKPLFHIQQPAIKFPKAEMQDLYSSKKAEIEKQRQAIILKEKNISENTIQEVKEKKGVTDRKEEMEIESTSGSEHHTKSMGTRVEKKKKIQEVVIKSTEDQKGVKDNKPAFDFQTGGMPAPSFKRVRSFKEMGTLERLDYLIDFPKQLPPVPCIFEIEGNTIRGFLIAKSEEQIEIKQVDGTIDTIPIQALKEVRMVGLRR